MTRQKALRRLVAASAFLLLHGTAFADVTLLSTSADAHIDGNNPEANYGAAEVLDISQDDLGGHKAYLLFDASGLGSNVTRIGGVQITSSSALTRTYSAYVITGEGVNDWTEANINWNNAPANSVTGTDRHFIPYPGQTVTLLGSISGGGVGTVLTIPIGPGSASEAELLNALNTGSRKVTVGIRYNSTQITTVGFYSKEHADGSMAAALELLPPGRVLPATMDAHINWQFPTIPFGSADVLSLSQHSLGGQKAYLSFDASELGDAQAKRAERIRVYWSASANITRTMMFSLLTGTGMNDWNEYEITWDNAPANNTTTNRGFFPFPEQVVTTLGHTQYVAGASREVNLLIPEGSAAETALLNALNAGDRKVTIGVSYNSSQETSVGIFSKERDGGIYTPTLWLGQKTPVTPTIRWAGLVEGRPVLELGGPENSNYVVLSSTNLTDWAQREILPVSQPPVQWADPLGITELRRFYRVRVQ